MNAFEPLGKAQIVEEEAARLRFQVQHVTVEITLLAPDLFRLGMFADGRPPDYSSEAVVKTAWAPAPAERRGTGTEISLAAGPATVHIALDPLRLRFMDAAGRVFAEDDAERGMGFVPRRGKDRAMRAAWGPPPRVYKRHPRGQRYFGCGERTSGLEKTDSHQVFWNIDPPVGHTASLNNLYTSIPFVLALQSGRAWGLFYDNAGRVEFDLAHEDPERAWFGADGGPLIYYLFAGGSPRDIVDRFTELTGRTPMPPLWALGNQQSRFSYMDAGELRALAREFRRREIPCDVLYLDIDHMDGYRVFTWDRRRFPEPEKLLAELREQGFRVVTIVDPGVKVDERFAVYRQAREAGFFCTTRTGQEYRNVVWPGRCAFPDFTNPRVREWWGGLNAGLLDLGVAGIWCDMNEPSLFAPLHSTIPEDTVHPGDGQARFHGQVHNVYGSLMARATREGLLKHRPEERPFVISRAGYAGLQRHALQWSGDNSSWWEHLWMSMPMLQNMGLSGVAWAGVDIGGFTGDASGELLARWVEFGIFQAFCRNHSDRGSRRQEPWAFGEPYESAVRQMLKLRQRLLPYLYTVFEECHRTGAPILRPLLFEYPEDETTYAADDEFLVGDALLVAPITRPGIAYRHVYLPAGSWFHLWSAEPVTGPAHVLAHAPLGRPAVYIKANTPLPLWPPMNYVGERPADPLTFLVFPAEGGSRFTLYEDAGDGYEYQAGAYSRREVACEGAGGRVTVRFRERHGDFRPPREAVELELRGFTAPPAAVRVRGSPAHWQHDAQENTLVIRLAEDPLPFQVDIERR